MSRIAVNGLLGRSVLIVGLVFTSFTARSQCMSDQEMLRLNQALICQGLYSPVDCYFISKHIEQEWVDPSYYLDQVNVDETKSNLEALAAMAALGFVVERTAVGSWVALRYSVHRLQNYLGTVKNLSVLDAKQTGRLTGLVRQVVNNPIVTNSSGRAIAITEKMVASRAAALAGRIGGGALNVLLRLSSWYLIVPFLFYELDNYYVESYEKRTGCTAEKRNSPWMCYKEDCKHHHVACAKSFDFVATLTPDQMREQLDTSPELCSYMKEHLHLTAPPFNELRGLTCHDGRPETFRVGAYSLPDLSPFADLGRRWVPGPVGAFQVLAKEKDASAGLEAIVVRFDTPVKGPGFGRLADLKYSYDEIGGLLSVTSSMLDYSLSSEESEYVLRRWGRPLQLAELKKRVSPPNDVGAVASIFSAGWSPQSRWVHEQQLLLHKALSELYGRAQHCCMKPRETSCEHYF